MRRAGGRVAWVNCAAGVAGDMLLGALADAGDDPATVTAAVAAAVGRLGLDPEVVRFEQVQRGGVRALHARVATDDGADFPHDHDSQGHDGQGHGHADDHRHDHIHLHDHGGHGPHRPARDVYGIIAAAGLPSRVRDRALAAYRALAEVEGRIHAIAPDDVELHEVGALDAIVDVVGVCAALDALGVERLVCSPIAVGHGTVTAAHGRLPNPAPAVVELLARVDAPVVGVDTTMELSTPTGVALVTTLAATFGPMPAMTVSGVGFGAGSADPPGRPNVVNVVIGTPTGSPTAARPGTGRAARLIEANVDDVSGEVLARTIAAALGAGAHDAWVTSIVMKKGRPAHTVHALCDDAALGAVADALVAETGTLGLRASTVERWPRRRTESTVDLDGHAVAVKVADDGHVKVEHDDAAAAAAALGLPLREVIRRVAERADPERHAGPPPTLG